MMCADTHSNPRDTLEANFEQIDTALSAFVAEMTAQGRWKDVTVVSTSEFGRTITSNGAGTG